MSDQNPQETPFEVPPTPEPAQAAPEPEPTGSPDLGESWKEVGRQFESLGQALGEAFRAAWGTVENRPGAQDLRSGFESLVRQVSAAIDESAATPQAQQLKEEAKKTAEKVSRVGEQTVQEARPHVVNALRTVSEELQKVASKMDPKA